MARPNWEYIRVDVLLPDHPKLDGLSYAARWTLIELWCWCGRNRTDGFVRDAAWRRIGPSSARSSLVSSGLCTRVEGGFQMHDYLGHQRSREQIEAVSEIRSQAGKRSAQARARPQQNAEHPVEQPVEQNLSKPATEAVAEAEVKLPVADLSNRSNGSRTAPPDRDEINQFIIIEICNATGKMVTVAWADKIAAQLLEGRKPADPKAYLRRAIQNEPNPHTRFLPISRPGYE